MADAPTVLVSPAPVQMAGGLVADAVAETLVDRPTARLAIAGGSAAKAFSTAKKRLDSLWSKTAVTWVDERCVPVTSPDSNRGAVSDLLHGAADVLPLFRDGETPAEAASRAAADLQARFDGGLDVLLLGMGGDGHIASLFPGRPAPGTSVHHVADSPKPPPDRITLSRAMLATARVSVLMAAGEGKRDALERVIAGDEGLPAVGLPGLLIVTDLTDLPQPRSTS